MLLLQPPDLAWPLLPASLYLDQFQSLAQFQSLDQFLNQFQSLAQFQSLDQSLNQSRSLAQFQSLDQFLNLAQPLSQDEFQFLEISVLQLLVNLFLAFLPLKPLEAHPFLQLPFQSLPQLTLKSLSRWLMAVLLPRLLVVLFQFLKISLFLLNQLSLLLLNQLQLSMLLSLQTTSWMISHHLKVSELKTIQTLKVEAELLVGSGELSLLVLLLSLRLLSWAFSFTREWPALWRPSNSLKKTLHYVELD
jgi:hypothetical protein